MHRRLRLLLSLALLSCGTPRESLASPTLTAASLSPSIAPTSQTVGVATQSSSPVAVPRATGAGSVSPPVSAVVPTTSASVTPSSAAPSLPTTVAPAPTPRPTPLRRTIEPIVGATAYDWFAQAAWNNPNAPWARVDPIQTMAANGVEWLRAGVTTVAAPELESIDAGVPPWRDAFWCSREYTLHVLEAGARAGMRLSLFFYLSDRAA